MNARTKRIAEECVAKGIPFVILPANDPYATLAYGEYVTQADTDDAYDDNYVRAVSSDLARMEAWQDDHPDEVKTPTLMEGEN